MAKGRARSGRGEAYWRRIVRQQAASGVTIRDFCRTSKLRESAFYFWRKELLRREAMQLRHHDHVPSPVPAAFVPVSVTTEAAESGAHEATANTQAGRIEIVLAGGQRIRVTAPVDRQALADVLAVLSLATDAPHGEGQPC